MTDITMDLTNNTQLLDLVVRLRVLVPTLTAGLYKAWVSVASHRKLNIVFTGGVELYLGYLPGSRESGGFSGWAVGDNAGNEWLLLATKDDTAMMDNISGWAFLTSRHI